MRLPVLGATDPTELLRIRTLHEGSFKKFNNIIAYCGHRSAPSDNYTQTAHSGYHLTGPAYKANGAEWLDAQRSKQ